MSNSPRTSTHGIEVLIPSGRPLTIKRKISGVYKITCTETGRCYIGQSGDITLRWNQHLDDLMSKRHVNLALQEAWDTHGLPKFNFTLMEVVQGEKDRLEREKHFIRENLAVCYNAQWDRGHSIIGGKIIHSSSGKEMDSTVVETSDSSEPQEDLVSKWFRLNSPNKKD